MFEALSLDDSPPTSTSAGVSLQFLTSITVIMSKVVSSRRFRSTFSSSSVISGPIGKTKVGSSLTQTDHDATPAQTLKMTTTGRDDNQEGLESRPQAAVKRWKTHVRRGTLGIKGHKNDF